MLYVDVEDLGLFIVALHLLLEIHYDSVSAALKAQLNNFSATLNLFLLMQISLFTCKILYFHINLKLMSTPHLDS